MILFYCPLSIQSKKYRQIPKWRKIVQGLKQWEEDEVITDYISNPVLNLIETIEKY